MKKFVDREVELQFLESQFSQNGPALVVIYGRRRVGKTALIKQFIKNKKAIYFLATEEVESQNINNFKSLVAKFFNNSLLEKIQNITWEEIFEFITANIESEKIIIVIDEFQYLCKVNPSFASILQKIWDERLKEKNVFLILCGSLINMMEQQVLNYSSPLYGRRTGQIKLKPLKFKYLKEFFPQATEDELIWLYAILGGVPKYLEVFNYKGDIFESIRENILNKQSFLYEEPLFLLEREIQDIGTYFSLIKSISMGNHKLHQIAQNLSVHQTRLTKYINTLIDLDMLRREIPVTEEYPEKSKKGLYFINDNFLNFWFKFVYPFKEQLELDNVEFVLENIKRKIVTEHISYVYEDVCREYALELSNRSELPLKVSKIGRWWDKNDEIDIVGIDQTSGSILYGECKYTNAKVDIDLFYSLKQKVSKVNLKNKTKEYYIIFSKSGFTERFLNFANEMKNLILINFPKRS
ncbi:ATP-binding protein [Anaerocellum danielii]|uniref:ATP-binding protein n=1 Tax=Anaerocellum danielii TaxID=1387557 RepID=A0ABZ0TYB2_9FIRM|nr:ATP-binding protein [Caldicellulosiruptor danielii]WPX07862.1 ATP-binding protein [Caldicellulosiruptor danielii]